MPQKLQSAVFYAACAAGNALGAYALIGDGAWLTALGVLALLIGLGCALFAACFVAAWDLDRRQAHFVAEIEAIRNRKRANP